MGLRQRILRVVEETGPRPKAVLRGLAMSGAQRINADRIIRRMLDAGALVMLGKKRGARYGVPKRRAAA